MRQDLTELSLGEWASNTNDITRAGLKLPSCVPIAD
jgi:hypothetical protein